MATSQSSDMAAATIPTSLASCLISVGALVCKLQREPLNQNIHVEIKKVIDALVQSFQRDNEEGMRNTFLAEESTVIKKLESTLQNLSKLDPSNAPSYEALGSKLRTLKSATQTNAILGNSQEISRPPCIDVVSNNLQGSDLKAAFQLTSIQEQICLLLFTMVPAKAAIMKRQLKHWLSNGDEVVIKLLNKRLLQPVAPATVRNRKLASMYKMHQDLRSMVKNELKDKFITCKQNSMSLMHNLDIPLSDMSVNTVLNSRGNSLNTSTLNRLSKMRRVEVVHLGNWDGDTSKYIVVEDVEALANALKQMNSLLVLSLEGVSGIVELPSSVYELKNLRVLNLRGCHNMEYLPVGIEKLRLLEYLDLSECYLLDHVPKGITRLTNLKVLKGFIIPTTYNHPQDKCALLSDLSTSLQSLQKLSLRARSVDFPTPRDLQNLCDMKSLSNLKITWVGETSSSSAWRETISESAFKFPPRIVKLVVEAAPGSTVTRLTKLITVEERSALKKLYIKGGGVKVLVGNNEYKVLRLQYLAGLRVSCYSFLHLFPNLHRLEMSVDVLYSLLHQSFIHVTGSRALEGSWNE